jgi:hypothetical protein
VAIERSNAGRTGSVDAQQTASSRAWHYDAAANLLYLRVVQGRGNATVSIVFSRRGRQPRASSRRSG